MAATMLQMVGKEIELIHENGQLHENRDGPVDVLISKCSRHYFVTIDFVHQFNRCFGCLLLVLIAPAFIRIINASFQLMINLKDGHWTMDMIVQLMILLVHCVLFTLVANIPHKIRQEVRQYKNSVTLNSFDNYENSIYNLQTFNLTKKLRKLYFDDFSLQNQVGP